MPTHQASTTTFSDHRIFGFDRLGQIRANLHNGPGSPEAGAKYSWVVCDDVQQLAGKLADLWEQPLSDDEFEVLERLEASMSQEVDCDECNATGVDPGGLSAFEPEACGVCNGAKTMTLATVYAPRVAA